MKLQFDKNQSYQLEAIRSVVALFEGQQPAGAFFQPDINAGLPISGPYTANRLTLPEDALLQNLQKVQEANQLRPEDKSSALEKLTFNSPDKEQNHQAGFPNYSVEMETGTGKTYIYLRTIHELYQAYGWKKFLIVVPSVAIREGVLKSISVTIEHFREIYGHQPFAFNAYDASRLSDLSEFARSNALRILVINIDAFARDINVIQQERESGLRPIAYIQQSRPVVILDEPQNMETDLRKKAIANLQPLFTLRYSATHKNLYNLVYRLDPVKAYDLGLVKQIEVDSVIVKNEDTSAFISLDGFRTGKKQLKALLTLMVAGKTGVGKKQVAAKVGDSLYELSGGWHPYPAGCIITGLDASKASLTLSDGRIIYQGKPAGSLSDIVLRQMIDATVENHFHKEKLLQPKGIKVLSIFFVDKVANYRNYDEKGNAIPGKFTAWLEESIQKWLQKPDYQGLLHQPLQELHDGYFSQDKGRFKDSKEGKPTRADDEAYHLIMRDKERLLDLATPLRFIFSHTALREGWDNPNVFQICTLNETRSELKKRQEIGRGLRLCVDQSGARNTEKSVNILTVIANEAYESFCLALQKEMEEECGISFEGRIRHARRPQPKIWGQEEKPAFYQLKEASFETERLIAACVAAIRQMPRIERPHIVRAKRSIRNLQTDGLLATEDSAGSTDEINPGEAPLPLPDPVDYLQAKTGLTRAAIARILLQSGRLSEAFNHPALFLETVAGILCREIDR